MADQRPPIDQSHHQAFLAILHPPPPRVVHQIKPAFRIAIPDAAGATFSTASGGPALRWCGRGVFGVFANDCIHALIRSRLCGRVEGRAGDHQPRLDLESRRDMARLPPFPDISRDLRHPPMETVERRLDVGASVGRSTFGRSTVGRSHGEAALDGHMRRHAIDGTVDDAGERDLSAAVADLVHPGLDAPRLHRIDGQQTGGEIGGNLPGLAYGDRFAGEKIVDQQGIERCFEEV